MTLRCLGEGWATAYPRLFASLLRALLMVMRLPAQSS